MTTRMLDAALDYARAGFRIFPCWGVRQDGSCECNEPGCSRVGKHPVGRLAPHGFHDASDDEERVASWWRQMPTANIALATGRGLFVVDGDRKGDVDGTNAFLLHAAEHGELPETATVDTGGGGAHFYFGCDDDLQVITAQNVELDGVRLQNVDIRGDGGYVMLPPSRHASGRRYVWRSSILDRPAAAAPGWILGSVVRGDAQVAEPLAKDDGGTTEPQSRTPAPPRARKKTTGPFRDGIPLSEPRVAEIRDALSYLDADCPRDVWMNRVAMPLHDETGGSEQGFQLWFEWSASVADARRDGKPVFPGEAECRRQWAAIGGRNRNPKGIRTLFQAAKEAGWPGVPGAALDQHEPGLEAPPEPPSSTSAPTPDRKPRSEHSEQERLEALADLPRNPGAFPTALVDELDGPIGAAVDWMVAAARRPDPVISLGAALALFGAVLGRRVVGPGGSRPTLCIAVLAPSGAGKEIPQECAKNAILAHPNVLVGLVDDAPTHRTQLDVELLDHKGQLLLLLDEYGSLLNRWLRSRDSGADTMSPTIRRLATAGNTLFGLARVSSRHPDRTKREPAWSRGVFAPALTLAGFSTPSQFYDAISEASLADGFLGRHIVLATRSTFSLKTPTRTSFDFPPAVSDWLEAAAMVQCSSMQPPAAFRPRSGSESPEPPDLAPSDPLQVPWADAATQASWERLVRDLDWQGTRAAKREDEAETAVLRRLPGQIASLALVLACGEADRLVDAVIAERHLHLAHQICRWSAAHLGHRFRHGVADDAASRAMIDVQERVEEAAGRKLYLSRIRRAATRTLLYRILPTLRADPRYEVCRRGKWIRLAVDVDADAAD